MRWIHDGFIKFPFRRLKIHSKKGFEFYMPEVVPSCYFFLPIIHLWFLKLKADKGKTSGLFGLTFIFENHLFGPKSREKKSNISPPYIPQQLYVLWSFPSIFVCIVPRQFRHKHLLQHTVFLQHLIIFPHPTIFP